MITLTNAQQVVVDQAKGKFLVRACPGSGKTLTMAYKAFKDINEWKRKREGVALLSFTNAAQEELADEIEKVGDGHKIVFPHYIGTIDSFINKYIFFPYINLLGFKPEELEMIGEPFNKYYGWSLAQRCALKFKYKVDGTLFMTSGAGPEASKAVIEKAKIVKRATVNKGCFTQADANYYSLKILQLHPEVVDAVSARFPSLYLDEAQDTTAIHWAIVKLLAEHKSNEQFGVIGDPDQSIYSWNGAHPDIFIAYQAELERLGNVFMLNDCRRSSQVLCDFYYKFSNLTTPPKAIDPALDEVNAKPTLVYYDTPKDIESLVETYKYKIGSASNLVLCRSSDLIQQVESSLSDNPLAFDLNPFEKDDKLALSLAHAKYDFDAGNYRSALFRAERVIFTLNKKYDQQEYLTDRGITRREWFSLIEDDLRLLPSAELSTREWCDEAASVMKASSFFRTLAFKIKGKNGKIAYGDTVLADYFSDVDAEDVRHKIDTVHSAKGKTTDHVFLILNEQQAQRVLNVVSGKTVKDSEEKRVLYVAITRARKSVTFCVPSAFKSIAEHL